MRHCDRLALGFVLPVIRRVFSSKEKILQSFFDVPIHVANDLYKQALAQLHSMLAEDGDADFDDLNELDNEIMAADAKRQGNEGGDGTQQDKGAAGHGAGAPSAKGSKRQRRRIEQSSSWKAGLLLILKFGVPIVGIVGFYLFYASLRFAEDNHLLGSERMLGSAARQNVQMELLIYHARALAFPNVGSATLTPSANLTNELSALQGRMRMVSNRITFGDPLMALPSITDLTNDLSTLYLEDLCTHVRQRASCSAFSVRAKASREAIPALLTLAPPRGDRTPYWTRVSTRSCCAWYGGRRRSISRSPTAPQRSPSLLSCTGPGIISSTQPTGPRSW